MQLTPLIAIHMSAAIAAIAIGPVALWARKGHQQRPRLHRAFGYAWVTLMLVTALSALFIRDFRLPNIAGYTPIHLFVPYVLINLVMAFRALAQKRIDLHRKIMTGTYIGACLVAGIFTLLPGRFLGNLIFVQWLGLMAPAGSAAPAGPSMLGQIVSHTPVWVWGLLAGLMVLGFSQARKRKLRLVRIALLPLGMAGFSLYGTVAVFGASALVLGSWLAACVLMALLVARLPAPGDNVFDSASREFELPGSWVPMALILAIFLTKYGVGISLALHPELRANASFCLVITSLYGVFSGIFAGRAARLLQMALQPAANGGRSAWPFTLQRDPW